MVISRAAVADGKGAFCVENIEVGDPIGDEILVELRASGICHTDWDSIRTWRNPFIIGHEGAGIVRNIGPEVTKVKPGDNVILNWAIPCGNCFQCQHGNLHICHNNNAVISSSKNGHAHPGASMLNGKPIERSFHLGTLCEFTVVKEAAVVKSSIDIPYTSASIIGCGVMTGYGSVVNAANVKAGSSICVVGCGGVGLNVIQAAKISGAATIIAIDLKGQRLEQAKLFGATHTILADKKDAGLIQAISQVKQITNNIGADYAFECTAVPTLGAVPLALIRNAGIAVQVSGIEQTINFDCSLFEWDKYYINPLYGQCKPEVDFRKILSLYQQGRLKLDELVTKTYTLDELNQGFSDMLEGKVAKAVVVFNEASE
ncbi:Zn-dependent alcohol dehydrogenase [Agarilytica rhodophyticola]|uniref:Zn-dependent alcohol dehydrogenase n=1 Tax=Agarilytica rhodophyticola TaxID=1737490 RepID=UPI000B346DA3|nr:Zn-dependent alcohol dehydrogenase [Agarilytica rhodophyticola]